MHRNRICRLPGDRLSYIVPAILLLAAVSTGSLAVPPDIVMEDKDGAAGRTGAPVFCAITLSAKQLRAAGEGRLYLVEKRDGKKTGAPIPVQFQITQPPAQGGRLWWQMPPGPAGRRVFSLAESRTKGISPMLAKKDETSGQLDIREGEHPVLRYNLKTIEPGDILSKIAEPNRIYARARNDYIHPLYGLDGEELTKDWSVDHPHHRGIYWAWPEVDWHGERGDLHALQRVFSRPTGRYELASGPVYAQITAESLWKWEDREPIVRETAVMRAYRSTSQGRCLDLEFTFTALGDDVALARRGTEHYGGLNIRLSAVTGQEILFHTDPADANPRMAWADLSGAFPGGRQPAGITVLQNRENPDYPGDWVKYPELNWFQPTFPASGTRYVLKKDPPLTLRFRLWIHRGNKMPDEVGKDLWQVYNAPPVAREKRGK
jgi:hypothetical protein